MAREDYRNGEGYYDPTAGEAIQCADQQIRRGEIYYIGIPFATGSEMQKDRPGIIVSCKKLNDTSPWPNVDPIYSPVSNTVTIGSGSFYSDASSWAKPELSKANELGLIPAILNGADMTKPITREEFCELAVLLYETVTESTAVPASQNPFTDTVNSQILKAYALGITTGTSATTFSPNTLINREQCAAMLFRGIKAIVPNADYSVAGVKDFPDQKDISSWAVEATKYMSKLGIIKGDSSGSFMPKAVTQAQVAAGYGMATREAAILMTVRTYATMK